MIESIGYGALDPQAQAVYRLFEGALLQGVLDVSIPGALAAVDAVSVLAAVIGDHPESLRIDRTVMQVASLRAGGKRYLLSGLASPAPGVQADSALAQAADRAMAAVRCAAPTSDYDILCGIYAYLQANVRYDDVEQRHCERFGRTQNPWSHNAYGALVQGSAVCDGIAAALALLAQRFGIAATIIRGKSAFQAGGYAEHAWNLVKLGGIAYHLDATWDINIAAQMRQTVYAYFCVSDDTISMDHDWDMRLAPRCPANNMDYHLRSGCYAGSLTRLEDVFRRALAQGATEIRARLAHGIAIPEPAEAYLGGRLASLAGRRATVHCLWVEAPRCFVARLE